MKKRTLKNKQERRTRKNKGVKMRKIRGGAGEYLILVVLPNGVTKQLHIPMASDIQLQNQTVQTIRDFVDDFVDNKIAYHLIWRTTELVDNQMTLRCICTHDWVGKKFTLLNPKKIVIETIQVQQSGYRRPDIDNKSSCVSARTWFKRMELPTDKNIFGRLISEPDPDFKNIPKKVYTIPEVAEEEEENPLWGLMVGERTDDAASGAVPGSVNGSVPGSVNGSVQGSVPGLKNTTQMVNDSKFNFDDSKFNFDDSKFNFDDDI